MLMDLFAPPGPLSDAEAAKMRQTTTLIRRGRFGTGNFSMNNSDTLHADQLAKNEAPDMVRRLLLDHHMLEEQLEAKGRQRALDTSLDVTEGCM